AQQITVELHELPLQLGAAFPLLRQIIQQPQPCLTVVVMVDHLGFLKVEALVHQRVERLEQAFLDRKGQGDQCCPLAVIQISIARSEEHTSELQSRENLV